MSAFKPYSHLMPSLQSPTSESEQVTREDTDNTDNVTRVQSPDSSARQLEYSVEKLLHCKSKSSGVSSSARERNDLYSSASGIPMATLSDIASTSSPSASPSHHWTNLNLLAQTLWWQNHKLSPFVSTVAQQSSGSSESRDNLLSAMTMASAASLYSPQLRRLLLPLSPATPLTAGRSQRGPRRQRTTFTHEQTLRLEMEYHVSEYISRGKRFQLADLLDLTESQIKIWFQNRRAKDKRIEKAVTEQQFRLLPIASSSSRSLHSAVNDACSTCDYTANYTSSKQLSTGSNKE